MQRYKNILINWLPLACAVTGMCLLVYGAVQQNYRQSFNDPQIQAVEDAVVALKNGAKPADIVGDAPLFDVNQSLKPFIAIYDATGKPIEANASIGNATPKPPRDIFTYAITRGEDRVTWQPNKITRIALVVKAVGDKSGLYVGAGRNMRELEAQESRLGMLSFLAWLAIIIATFVLEVFADAMRRRRVPSS